MLIILPLLFAFLAYKFNKDIRLNSIILYVTAVILSVLTFQFKDVIPFTLISNGYIGLSFIVIVMFTGAIKKGSKLKSQLRNVRKEYSILAFIFSVPHALLSIYNSILDIGYFEIFGLLTILFMFPLIFTSIPTIRNKIKTSTWLKIHRLSYIVFGLLFIHLISVSNLAHIISYCILFGAYLFLKLYHFYFKKHKLLSSAFISIIVIGGFSFIAFNDVEYNYDYINYLENANFQDGTYYGFSKGYRKNPTSVYVSIKDNVITNITLDDCGCTPYAENGFYLDSAYAISNKIVHSNRTDVDAISGATITSISINEAVINALKEAKK